MILEGNVNIQLAKHTRTCINVHNDKVEGGADEACEGDLLVSLVHASASLV